MFADLTLLSLIFITMKCADMFRKHKPYLHSTADQAIKNYSHEIAAESQTFLRFKT